MKISYVSPCVSEEVVSSIISLNQYIELGLVSDDPSVCGVMGIEPDAGNIAVFCSTSNEDFADELNGTEVKGCNGFTAELTHCIIFDSDKTDGQCPGLIYFCNTTSSPSDAEAIASVGDSECSECNAVAPLLPSGN